MKAESEIRQQAQFLAEELGECLLLVKVHELLEDKHSWSRDLARRLIPGELSLLSKMVDQKLGIGPISEQYLRVIYANEVAGFQGQASMFFRAFVETTRRSLHPGVFAEGILAFRLSVAEILSRDLSISALNLLDPESNNAVLIKAYNNAALYDLDRCKKGLEDVLDMAENQESISPWDDVWEYVLLTRLNSRLNAIRSPQHEPERTA